VVGYVFTDPPLVGPTLVTFRRGDEGRPEVVAKGPDERGLTTYVFTLVGPDLAATPVS
jgi:hypothetical protein